MTDHTTRDIFISILSAELRGEKLSVPMTEELLRYAKIHNVEAMVFQVTHAKELERANYYTVFAHMNMMKLMQEITKLFEEAGMRHFWVKGMEVAQYYPYPALRSMGDLDVMVEDIARACEILSQHGYDFGHHDQCEWPCYKNNFRVELQSRLAYSGSEKLMSFFDGCWDYEKEHHLDWSFHFVYLIEHLRKHLVHEGVGFRQFLDIAVLVQNEKVSGQLNWSWIRETLQKLDMLDLTERILALNERWFGVKVPFEVPEITDEFYDFATDRILENGVFGRDDEEHLELANVHVESSSDYDGSRMTLGGLLRKAFPGYRQLIGWDEYRFLVGRKYLLPVCWIYRLWRNLFLKEKREQRRQDAQIDAALYDEKIRELKEWGL